MTYTIDQSLNAKNFTPHDQVLEVFGTTRQTQSITIHHWGALGQKGHDILAWFCNPDTTAQTSAHFVVWDGNIYCIVSPNDAAWAAGNAYGNATSIHIECHPEATEGDYNTVAWLITWLRNTYGDMPLFPHKHWVTTDCPGVWDLNRLDTLARNNPTDPQEEIVTPDDIAAIATEVLNRPIAREGGPTGDTNLRAAVANLDALVGDIVNDINALKNAQATGGIDVNALANAILDAEVKRLAQ